MSKPTKKYKNNGKYIKYRKALKLSGRTDERSFKAFIKANKIPYKIINNKPYLLAVCFFVARKREQIQIDTHCQDDNPNAFKMGEGVFLIDKDTGELSEAKVIGLNFSEDPLKREYLSGYCVIAGNQKLVVRSDMLVKESEILDYQSEQ